VGAYCSSADVAQKLGDALTSLLQHRGGSRKGKGAWLDELAMGRALRALAAVWQQPFEQAPGGGQLPAAVLAAEALAIRLWQHPCLSASTCAY
jgi:hypothetical protein